MIRLSRFAFLSLLVITFFNGCKKDQFTEPDKEPDGISITMNETEAYQYTTIILEADRSVGAFDNKVFIDGVEISAGVIQDQYIAFTIQPEITAGSKKLKLKVDGKDFEFPLLVKDLPQISDPKTTYTAYIDFMETLGVNTKTAIEEAYKNANVPPDDYFASVADQLKEVNDSLDANEAKFNALSPQEQMVAAKIVSAHKLKLQPVYDFMESQAEFLKNPEGFNKRGGICEIQGNMSESWKCVLNETRKNTKILMRECVLNSVLGGATGALIGAIFGPAGLTAGATVGLATFQLLNAKLIMEYGFTLASNFSSAMVVTASEIGPRKSSVTYINGKAGNIKVDVARRNLQPEDGGSSITSIAEYLQTTQSFLDFVQTNFSRYVKTLPNYKPQRTVTKPLEKLEFVKVEVVNNTKVKFEGLSGTPTDLKLAFSTKEITDQTFEYKVIYNDGVFNITSNQSGVLKSEVNITLRDSTVSSASHVINFDIEAPEELSWSLSDNADWMFTTVTNGKGRQKVQLSIQESWETANRTGTINFSVNGNIVKTFKVIQTPKGNVIGKWEVEKTYFSEKGDPAAWYSGNGQYYVFNSANEWQYIDPNDSKSNQAGTYNHDKSKNELTLTETTENWNKTFKVDVLTNDKLVLKWSSGTDIDDIYLKKVE